MTTTTDSYSGSSYVFSRDHGGADSWGQVAKLTASDGAIWRQLRQTSVSISGDTVVVGALLGTTTTGTDSGSAYVFSRDHGGDDTWGQVAKLTASDGAGYDSFGSSVSISGDTVVVGALYRDDDNGSEFGFGLHLRSGSGRR
jgi:hypothetical protein